MGWTSKQVFLAILLVITGSINTLSTKWADQTEAYGRPGYEPRKFNHPFFQALTMFVGEMLCFLAFFGITYYERRQRQQELHKIREENASRSSTKKCSLGFNPFIFFPPAMCDLAATTTMYIGLTMTFASSYQMLRGSLIIFTGLLSVGFLNRTLHWFQWLGIVIVIGGLAVTGGSDFMATDQDTEDMNGIITGDLLIILAQIISATQMVLEEKFITKHNVKPLLVVGFEGTYGFITMGLMLIPANYIYAGKFSDNPDHRLEDTLDAFKQMGNSWQICLATVGSILSISFFNFAGVSVTKEISATTRTVLDSIRTLVVWVVSLGLKWQKFHFLQPVGYVLLVIGMFIYNDIIFLPFLRSRGWLNDTPKLKEQTANELTRKDNDFKGEVENAVAELADKHSDDHHD